MQKPPLQQLIDTEFKKLPKEVSDLFNSEENADIISAIAGENSLTEEQELSLFDEIAYVFFRVTPISNFKNEIKNTLTIDEKTALSISSEVYGKVFLPVKKFLIETTSDFKPTNSDSSEQNYQSNKALNHQDILNEIENPTPSIYPNTNTSATKNVSNSDSMVLDIDSLELGDGSIKTDVVKSLVNEVEASVPVLSGFKPITNDTHPAQPTADKLNSALESTIKTPVREIYQSKKPDPYHEPLE